MLSYACPARHSKPRAQSFHNTPLYVNAPTHVSSFLWLLMTRGSWRERLGSARSGFPLDDLYCWSPAAIHKQDEWNNPKHGPAELRRAAGVRRHRAHPPRPMWRLACLRRLSHHRRSASTAPASWAAVSAATDSSRAGRVVWGARRLALAPSRFVTASPSG